MSEKRTHYHALLCGGSRGVVQRFDHNEGGLKALVVGIALVVFRVVSAAVSSLVRGLTSVLLLRRRWGGGLPSSSCQSAHFLVPDSLTDVFSKDEEDEQESNNERKTSPIPSHLVWRHPRGGPEIRPQRRQRQGVGFCVPDYLSRERLICLRMPET